MKRLYISLLLFLSASTLTLSYSQTFNPFARYRQTISQNAVLLARIDSLQAVVDSLVSLVDFNDEAVLTLMEGNDKSGSETGNGVGNGVGIGAGIGAGIGTGISDYTIEVTDSLVGLWYEQSRLADFDVIHDFNMDSVRFNSDVPDSVFIRRLNDMNSFITLPYNSTVRNYILLYSEKRKEAMESALGYSNYYFPIFEAAFLKYGLPQELKYMAIIESMLNPVATSRAGARGMWQFMYNTAKIYGLHVDSFVDERLDVEKAVDAAARYLRDSYQVFGDWSLAISSYNCGAGNVSKAIRRAGGRRDFWSIYPYLPRETRGYMPAFVGAMYAMTYYKECGLRPADVGMPARSDTFEIRRKLHFSQINEIVGVPMDDLRNLNPEFIHDIVPGKQDDVCVLKLPYNWSASFMDANQDSLYTHRLSQLMTEEVQKAADARKTTQRIAYKIKEGDNLGRIALRYGVSVTNLKKWNNLKSSNIRAGKTLYIYKNGYYPVDKTTTASSSSSSSSTSISTSASAASSSSTSSSSASSDNYYTVKKGDTLYDIAKLYPGVSAENIKQANNLGSSSIRPGQKLLIPKR